LGYTVLEAIKCGAPVLAGDNSSMPEVVGNEARECLFDAASPTAIAAKIRHALENPGWTKHVHELQQKNAASFTLENHANYAVTAIRESFERFRQKKFYLQNARRPKVAVFTPLHPAQSGISNYNARLIPYMSKFFDIDAVIDNGYEVDDPDIEANCGIMSVEAFERKQSKEPYDILVFHIGNSHFHTYMLPPLVRHGGLAVIHDVYLDGLTGLIDEKLDGGMRNIALFLRYSDDQIKYFESHAKNDDTQTATASRVQLLLSCLVTCAYGVLVHSEHAKSLLENFYIDYDLPTRISRHGAIYFGKADEFQRQRVRKKLGIEDGKTVCGAMGMVTRAKDIDLIVDTLIESENRYKTILVLGGAGDGDWVESMIEKAERNGLRLIYTGYLGREEYDECISMLDFAFALRGETRGETSGALLEIMGHGVPAITYDMGSFSEISDDAVCKIPYRDKGALLKSIDRLVTDKELRENISISALEYVKRLAFPRQAEEYASIVSEAMKYKERIKGL
jgi:glycosyltransferase involved in cell wall biosynthesis